MSDYQAYGLKGRFTGELKLSPWRLLAPPNRMLDSLGLV